MNKGSKNNDASKISHTKKLTQHQSMGHTQPLPSAHMLAKGKPPQSRRKCVLGWYDSLLDVIDKRVDHDGDKPEAIFQNRTSPPHFALSVAVTSFRLLFIFILILCFLVSGSLLGIARAYINTAPDLDLSALTETALASQIYDQNGELIATYSGTENRLWATYNEFPGDLVHAIVSIEDTRFFSHSGVDIKRIMGSFISNFTTTANVQGASTITQQLIKNRMLTSERSYRRKIQEAYLAYQLENEYSKEQILEAYLNDVNLSQGNYGVKSAALDYLGKDLSELTLRECAMLAGMVQSPYTYDPRRNYFFRNRPEVTDNRTNTVLSRMYQQGYITYDQYEQALAEQVVVLEESASTSAMGLAPSFVDYVIKDVIDHFIESRGLPNTQENRNAIEYELRTAGYQIYTTLDLTVQTATEDAVYNYDNYPATRYRSDAATVSTNADGSTTEVVQPQAGVVVMDYHTGQIKAMIGGRTAPTGLKVLNRAYMSHQPVGSSIKPITVYGPAIDRGLGAASIIQNFKGEVSGWSTDGSYPNTGSIVGPVTMRTALSKSLNLSAARILMEMSGLDSLNNSAAYLEMMGVDMDYINVTPAGIALGTSGLSPLDEAVCYATIANKGLYISPISFTKVEDGDHSIILDAVSMQTTKQVYKPGTAWLLVDMMTTGVESGTGTKAQINGITVAGKTGTNDNYRGITFAGITPHYTTAIYIGHDDYKPLKSGTSGGAYAAPLFSDIMTSVYNIKGLPNGPIIEDSPESLGLVQVTVCQVSGQLATDACSLDMGGLTPVTDWYPIDSVPTETCTMHVAHEVCTQSGKLATSYCTDVVDKAYVLVPTSSVLAHCDLTDFPWYYVSDEPLSEQSNPDAFCNIHTTQNAHAKRVQAIQNANDALAHAAIDVQPYLDSLNQEQVGSFHDAVNTLTGLIGDGSSASIASIDTATEALDDLLDELAIYINNE